MEKNMEILAEKVPSSEIVVNEHVTLRQTKINEAERMFQLIDENREYLSKWLPFPEFTKTVDDSADYIKSTIEKRKNNEEYSFAIYIDDVFYGHTSIMHISDGKSPEIGYWISEQASGMGVTTASTKAMTEFGLNELNLDHIIIRADINNAGSNKVAEKSGYTLTDTRFEEGHGMTNIWIIKNII